MPRAALRIVCTALMFILAAAARAEPMHGIAMHGEPSLAVGFAHFPHVNPEAPKGGRLTLGVQGTFDSLNPFIIKGAAAQGLREYVYESLMARSPDEPFSLYGLIAEKVDVPQDRSAITFFLRAEARFSDGKPLTAADVLFSYDVLREAGLPFYRGYYKKVVSATAPDARTVVFKFAGGDDRELPLILGLMPILPKHRLSREQFERTSLEPPVGSGPYLVASVDPGRSMTLRRDPAHWASHLNVTRGRFNFDAIRYDYFRDANTLFEAFTAGQVDLRTEEDPGRWAQAYRFPAVANGLVTTREFETGLPAGMSALVLNTRKPPFDDKRVRLALMLAFDFSWLNRNLYHSLYARTQSLFERSYLASTGRPADATERELLAPFPDAVSDDVMAGRFRLPDSRDGSNRQNLRLAADLLREAGYELNGGVLVHQRTRQPLRFEFLGQQTRAQERLMLAYKDSLQQLGISVFVRSVDSSQYWARIKKFDFDMVQMLWRSSLSPGNEQFNRWGSGAADTQGSLNLAGVRSPAADAMIEAMLRADTKEKFVSATRALDRVIMSGDYMVPLFHVRGQWIAYWRRITPPRLTPLSGLDLDSWWQAPG